MHIVMPPFGGMGGGGLFYNKCHKQYSCSVSRTYWSCFGTAKTHRFANLFILFSSKFVLF
jgi:hypothetical protein